MAKPRWGRSIDEWVARIFAEDENDLPDDDPWGRVERALTLAWPSGPAQRDAVRRTARAAGATTILYALETDPAEAWRRVEARNREPGGSIVMARTTFDELRSRVEPLGADEPHIVVRATRPDEHQ